MLRSIAFVCAIAIVCVPAGATDVNFAPQSKILSRSLLIEGQGLRLRRMTPESRNEPKFDRELTRVLETLTDQETKTQFWGQEVSEEMLEAAVSSLESGPQAISEPEPHTRAFFVIADTLRDQVLGVVTISWAETQQRFLIGYAVHPGMRGQRVGTRAVQLVQQVLKSEQPGADVVAIVHEDNLASRTVLANSGFGLRHMTINKKSRFVCVYALEP